MDAHELRIEQGRKAALCVYCAGGNVPANAMGAYYGGVHDTVRAGLSADGSSELVTSNASASECCV